MNTRAAATVRLAANAAARSNPALGTALMVAASGCFAFMDNSVRLAGRFAPVMIVLFARYVIQVLVMGTWLASTREGSFRCAHPGFQVLRGVMLLTMSGLAFITLRSMPAAEYTAISMLSPLMVTLLAGWLLRERVSVLRWSLVCGGFIGALIVVRPGSGLFGWLVLLPLTMAFIGAAFQLLTAKLAGKESPYTTHFFTGLTGIVLLAPALLIAGVDVPAALMEMPTSHRLVLLAIGLLGTVGHLLLILSLGQAPASTLTPFAYTQLALTAGASWLFFRNVPDFYGWLGMAVIAACGATAAWLNVRDTKRPVSPVTVDTTAD